ncbi:hypothetical protein ACHAXR_004266, partial [Thalassiosira sp. AJA248-18]
PGAGKTTCANAAVRLLNNNGTHSPSPNYLYLNLDLDVCVPQWMRDNFDKGIYPTLEQRNEFMLHACDYVKGEINAAMTNIDLKKKLMAVISFSFVNTDLRTAFRGVFPHAQWILVDTHKKIAEERISAREGHFYKNANSSDDKKIRINEAKEAPCNVSDDNAEWEFRPVDFPHTILNGRDDVEVNAKQIVKCIESHILKAQGHTI